ncbi:MAG TPA: hypothetical protein PLJ29_06245 [Leptospiraceae bacterium]|nr:hypothetical protein [Leptospiraceae bacterium]
MSTTNSKLIQHINAKNISATAKNSQAAAEAAKVSAEASLLNAEATFQVLRENLKQTDLLKKNLYVAIENNDALKEINVQLEEIGKGIGKFGQAIKEQTKLHKEHYDELKKEKALKEVLYNIKKYFKSLETVNDMAARAYGAKTLLNFLNAGDLKTKDLSDIKDKEFYDEQLESAENSLKNLSAEVRKELEDFEKLYSSYYGLKEADLRKEFPKYQKLNEYYEADYTKIEDDKPQPPMEIKRLDSVDWNAIEGSLENQKFAKVTGYATVGLFILMVSFCREKSSQEIMAGITSIPLWAWIYFRYKISTFKTDNLSQYQKSDYKHLVKMREEYNQRLQRYEAQASEKKSELNSEVGTLNKKMELENDTIVKYNKSIDEELADAEQNRRKILETMKSDINSYLDSHPKIQEFLPKV